MPKRRAQRSEKLCEFQVKNPTGRIAPTWSSDPSTRQYTASRWSGRAPTRTPVGRSETLVEGGKFSLIDRETSESAKDWNANNSCRGRFSAPTPVWTLVDLGRCLANDPFRHQNCAPTKQNRQHVTNCKVNIISGLPQERR